MPFTVVTGASPPPRLSVDLSILSTSSKGEGQKVSGLPQRGVAHPLRSLPL